MFRVCRRKAQRQLKVSNQGQFVLMLRKKMRIPVALLNYCGYSLVGSCLYILMQQPMYMHIYRAAACDVTGGMASLNFDATELQILKVILEVQVTQICSIDI